MAPFADEARDALSSWDNCMAISYCKWPVIVAIIAGGLLAISLFFCLFRWLCCGLVCCCGCLSCFNVCCPSPRKRGRNKKTDPDLRRSADFSYKPERPKSYFAKFAMFDAHSGDKDKSKFNDDDLPPMPSWDRAKKMKIEEESVEDPRKNDISLMNDFNNSSFSTRSDVPPMPRQFPVKPDQYALHGQSQQQGYIGSKSAGGAPYRVAASPPPVQMSGQIPGFHPAYNNTNGVMMNNDMQGARVPSPYDKGLSPQWNSPMKPFHTRYGGRPDMQAYGAPYLNGYNQEQPPTFAPRQDPYLARKPLQNSWRDI